MHMLLQILEEGTLTDSLGRHVDFRNTVVILTSNLGFDAAHKGAGLGFGSGTGEGADAEAFRKRMMEEAKRAFKPEFLNRFDDMIVFRRLDKSNVSKILTLELSKVRERLAAKGKRIELTRSAREFLIEKGYDEASGARPLRRAVERYIEDPLAEEILKGSLADGKKIEVTRKSDALVFRTKEVART
jgi:ATP-dependent Clp protease ATP-binding subunit ClpC